MNKIYTRMNWENYPSEATALNETNLNKVDLAVDELDNRIIYQDTVKLSKTDATDDIVDWSINETTGVITITRRSGEQILFDLNIEKIPVDFKLSEDGILTMTTDDGTKFTANIGAMIPVLTFNDSDEITVSVSGEGINKIYSFSIKTNSITEDKLQPNFLADIKVESANASTSSSSASASATDSANSAYLSESYAVGGTGTRTGEDTDNAKYYNEQAQEALSKIQSAQVTGVKGNNETEYRKGEVNLTSQDIGSIAVGGDVSENTVAFTSNDSGPDGEHAILSVDKLTTGEKISSIMNKISRIFTNTRYILDLLGTNDITSESVKIGDGTVTGALRTLNDSLMNKINLSKFEYISGFISDANPYDTFDLLKIHYTEPLVISSQIQLADGVWTDINKIPEITAIRNNKNQIRLEKTSASAYGNYKVRFLLYDVSE